MTLEELREQAAKIADQYADNNDWSWSPRRAPEVIAAAIRAIPLPAPVALPQAGEGVTISREMFNFLRGSGPLEGSWFGDRREGEPGAYWWRKRLHVMDATPTETPTAAAPDDGLMGRYREALGQVMDALANCELNMSNYDVDGVSYLNQCAVDAYLIAEAALSTATGDEAQQGEG